MSSIIDPDWSRIPLTPEERERKKWMIEELGMDETKCSECGSLTREGICLNACHLSTRSRARFNDLMSKTVERMDNE